MRPFPTPLFLLAPLASHAVGIRLRGGWICLWLGALWAGCTPALIAGEEFENYYLLYLGTEKAAEANRESHGDVFYLQTLHNFRVMLHVNSHYRLFGAHPEVGPPNWPPDKGEPPILSLTAGRVFVHKHYLDLWAAAYLEDQAETLRREKAPKKEDPFADLVEAGEEAEIDDPFANVDEPEEDRPLGPIIRRRENLAFYYSEDLFLQKRVEDWARRYATDDTVMVAGLTGRQIIADMREQLPEADPRVAKSGSEQAQRRPIVDPAGRFSDRRVGTSLTDGSSGGRATRTFLWSGLCLVLAASVWGFCFVRSRRS